MATKVIKFPVAYRQNTNSYSSVYGHYFPIAWRPDTFYLILVFRVRTMSKR